MTKRSIDITKLYKTQQSLTEWLQDIDHAETDAIKSEDNDKRERLKTIHEVTGLPFDEPVQFPATALTDRSDELEKYVQKHGTDLCALRLIPNSAKLPKLRMRGLSVSKALEWFDEQDIDPKKYKADFVPHDDKSIFSTIFVVNEKEIFGEIIRGPHYQLTQGFYDGDVPIEFQYDFHEWFMSREDENARAHLRQIMTHLKVDDQQQKQLNKKLHAEFSNGYLKGYFETTYSDEFGLWFKDYNQTLGRKYEHFQAMNSANNDQLSGRVACDGEVTGVAHVVLPDDIDEAAFKEGSVLVCSVTSPDYLPLMVKSSAIVTDQGGILSHAAIVARELNIPCIVGTTTATKTIRDGDTVNVNANTGVVEVASN